MRAGRTYLAQHMTDRAATLTYFAMMSLFPALLVGVTLLGLFGQQGLVDEAANYLLDHGAAPSTVKVIHDTLNNMISTSSGALGVTLLIGLALALNGASGAFGAAGRALNEIYEIDKDSRGMVRRKANDLGIAIVVILLFLVTFVAIFLGGQIADDLFGKIGLGDDLARIWSYVRWPVAVLATIVAYALVYSLAPDREPRRVHWISTGAIVGVLLWLVLSFGFTIYVRNFAHYGAVYGAFGTAIVLLLWLYLSANAFLFGAELNAELARTRGSAPGP